MDGIASVFQFTKLSRAIAVILAAGKSMIWKDVEVLCASLLGHVPLDRQVHLPPH